jgi:GNAT superfamily N-acetyltransferase
MMVTTIRPLTKQDLSAARRIVSLAFGTFLGAPDPANFWTDLDYVGTRWPADPGAAFGAEMDGELVASNFATRWGSVGFFGPLTVRPDLWDQNIGRQLMEPILRLFDEWKVTHAGLFTFAHSAKHVGLYQSFGFWPRFLTAIMGKPVAAAKAPRRWTSYSELPEKEREEAVRECRELTSSLYPGLDVEREIRAVQAQNLGETVLVRENGSLDAFAVCHCGPGTEAGAGKCYVKFGAARPIAPAAAAFGQLLAACEHLASDRGLTHIEAGMSLAREQAYRQMVEAGYRAGFQGVTMHRPNEPGYSRRDIYLIDDWR